MLFTHPTEVLAGHRLAIAKAYRCTEHEIVEQLLDMAHIDGLALQHVKDTAMKLVEHVRKNRMESSGIDSFLNQYSLSSEEGIAMMCLAEALLRVPDKATIDDLIKDKLSGPNWSAYLGQSHSLFVNATTWALMLTGRILEPQESTASRWSKVMRSVISRSSEGVIRKAVGQAMKIMSKQFVMGRNIKEAIKRAKSLEKIGYRYSYDMLGEAAMTEEDALRYQQAYLDAIAAIGKASNNKGVIAGPGISVKLSALYPRYEVAKRTQVLDVLVSRVLQLALAAKELNIGLTIDAEEANRLDLSLDVIERVFSDPQLSGWEGFGLAVQSYQKRASFVLDWLAELARKHQRRIMVRLIKGAYWDSEIKHSQMEGLTEYPVFTYKTFTDVSFQACAIKLFKMQDAIYPQFATHNAYSVALILELAGDNRDFEFQCLHGMGQELYSMITPASEKGIPCRIYAPVGTHEDLLPYLVRRLLENGANSSFVNRIVDDKAPIEDLVQAPIQKAHGLLSKMNQAIPLPKSIFGSRRDNSNGLDVSDYLVLQSLEQQMLAFADKKWQGSPLLGNGAVDDVQFQAVFAPAELSRHIGEVAFTQPEHIEQAVRFASEGHKTWSSLQVLERSKILLKLAELLEENRVEAYALLMLEAGKVLNDAIAEVREAIDFCRYYARQASKLMNAPTQLHGYTGETNLLSYHSRGTMLCISPWNFPLAIFLGQIAACIAVGNTVIAKPAEQTSLIATFTCQLMYRAGVPQNVVQLLPGTGKAVGAKLVEDPRIAGVLFTGSTQTAKHINQILANREGTIVPLIAETGGQNAMIVDSSALLEQVTRDVLNSSFGSAGQRCSALRVLYVQKEIYQKLQKMIIGALSIRELGLPQNLTTDFGPVIDERAKHDLMAHIDKLKQQGKVVYQLSDEQVAASGHFVPPTIIELDSIAQLSKEHFGPILHMIPYEKKQLDKVIGDINATGYGLTLGIHSRVEDTVEYIASQVHVGNCYINRNTIGAVVGLQPFGGEGLSGTGPKAGGPNYLLRLCHERTLTIDTTAAGGNASLMAQSSE